MLKIKKSKKHLNRGCPFRSGVVHRHYAEEADTLDWRWYKKSVIIRISIKTGVQVMTFRYTEELGDDWYIDVINRATSSAIIYNIAETAKVNNLKLFDYVEYLLTEIPKHTDDRNTDFLAGLLHRSKTLPEYIRKSENAEVAKAAWYLSRYLSSAVYKRLEIQHTLKHGSWLNIAEIGLNVMIR